MGGMDVSKAGPCRPLPPALMVGSKSNAWTVTENLGHSKTHPVTGKPYKHGYWWYGARCSCGRKAVLNQKQLFGRKSKKHCNHCEAIARQNRDTTQKPRPSNALPPELDFARLRLRTGDDT